MEIETHKTIQSFYAGQSIFITGGTGFLGKVLIEKLLRSCSDISTIYLLIRSKKDKCPESRLDEMFEEPIYDRVKKEVPNFRKKIVPIIGDLNIEDFRLSENDQKLLINEVSIIFHIAANVRFDENIKTSTIVNIDAVATILKLAKHMTNLKSLIHVSTTYANCHMEHIEERFYSYPINHKDLIMFARNLSNENVIEKKISRILSRWHNTYTFTKAIAEGLLSDESGDLPVGIFRPAVVTTAASEPLVGWIDNMYGSISIIIYMLHGILRFYRCNVNVKANIVPVDFTVNALIASAWDVFNQRRKGKNMLIYNFVPVDGPTLKKYIYTLFDINKITPLHNAIYFPLIILVPYKILYRICVWLGHFLPALLMDVANICINRRSRITMWKLYKKVDKRCKAFDPFCNTEWSYSTDNVQAMWNHLSEEDQQLFKFNMIGFDWTKYLIDLHQGIRHYLLNEDDSTLEISRIKYKRFYWIHQTLKTVFIFAVFWIIWRMFIIIYN